MKKTDHHVIPCSLDGLNIEFNILRVTQKEHELIHKTLCMPYWRIRKFRFANALCFRKDAKYYERLKNILNIYFERIGKLPIDLVVKQKKAICELIMLLNNKTYGYSVNSNMTMSNLIDAYCDVLLQISLSRENLI